MSRQYFSDTLSEPINADFATITAITETVLIPTNFTAIGANEPRAGKVYELIVGGTCTTPASGTCTVTPRYGTTIGGTSLGASAAQTVVPSVTNGAFNLRCWLAVRSIGNTGANSTVTCHGNLSIAGAAGTAASETSINWASAAAVSVDTSVAAALWIGITFSVAPSMIPRFHIWQSLN